MKTRLTELLQVEHPIMSAGMAGVAGPELVAAVSNAGGFGTLGAIGMSPQELRRCIQDTRKLLRPGRQLGVDLLLPKIGKNARATNKDYTNGQLEELVQVMIDEQVGLFVCAVGVPPRWVVDKLHANGILVMNMVGSPKHVRHCVAAGVDIICAQGTEAGGHTGDISTMVLLPKVVELCKGTGIVVVGAGGIYNGAGIAACLALGAAGAWLGSRFIMTEEANIQASAQQAIRDAAYGDTIRTEIYTGRPARTLKNAYNLSWERERVTEKHSLLRQGKIPWFHDLQKGVLGEDVASPIPLGYRDLKSPENDRLDLEKSIVPVGQICGALDSIKPATTIVEELVDELENALHRLR